MSHDSRYEAKCPQHGWYFFEDGCAVAGCENAPAVDQSGAFPEQGRPGYELREVAQRLRLMDLCGAHTPRAHFVTLGRAASLLEDVARALERPRPAPPEPSDAAFGTCDICDAPLPHATDDASLERAQIVHDAYAKFADRGGSAGTGAAPPDDCSPEYIDAIIAALNDAFSPVMPGAFDGSDSGRLVGALLKRGLRIYPVRGGAPQPPPSAPSLGLGNALAEAVKEFLLALAAQEEADDWADNLDGSADEDADNEAERDAVVATRRVQAAERRLKVARENWVSGVPREETNS